MIAVTGASGFLGSWVIQKLDERGVLYTGFSRSPSTKSLNLRQLDIREASDDLFNEMGQPESLIHLAWSGLPNYRSKHHLEDELPVHRSFLTSAVRSGIKTIVVAGTCFEYGMQSGELSETSTLLPENYYAKAKVELLKSLLDLQETEKFNLIWGRLFYIFGRGQAVNSLWSQFLNTVENGEAEFKMSGGQQIRDFLPAEIAAESLIMLAQLQQNAGVVNICSGVPVTVERLVTGWAKMMNWNGDLILGHFPYPDWEPMEFWGSREKLDTILNC